MKVKFKCTKEEIEIEGYWDTDNPKRLNFYDEYGLDVKYNSPHNPYDDEITPHLYDLFEDVKRGILLNYSEIILNCEKYQHNEKVVINYWYFTLSIN